MVVVLPAMPLQDAAVVVAEGDGRCVGDDFGAGEAVRGAAVVTCAAGAAEDVRPRAVAVADDAVGEATRWLFGCRAGWAVAAAEGELASEEVSEGTGGSEATRLCPPPHAASVSTTPTATSGRSAR